MPRLAANGLLKNHGLGKAPAQLDIYSATFSVLRPSEKLGNRYLRADVMASLITLFQRQSRLDRSCHP